MTDSTTAVNDADNLEVSDEAGRPGTGPSRWPLVKFDYD